MKQIGIYLVAGGAIVLILAFIGTILKFIINHPWMGLALLAVLAGVILILIALYQERNTGQKDELEEVQQ